MGIFNLDRQRKIRIRVTQGPKTPKFFYRRFAINRRAHLAWGCTTLGWQSGLANWLCGVGR
jgi:hypothetical protein